ncbi:MAG: formate dehydrogenase accessory sulfurtransferase FdhD [Candidatus Binatia bacterium]
MSFNGRKPTSTRRLLVQKIRGQQGECGEDVVVVEEPLEIRLISGQGKNRTERSISVTMRTPGHDFELAAGFLYTEGIVQSPADIEDIAYTGSRRKLGQCNTIGIHLHPKVRFDSDLLERHFYTTSSCGVCGKATLEALRIRNRAALSNNGRKISTETIRLVAERLQPAQEVFKETGGLHAAGLFDPSGNLTSLYEDVGRHNAVDKVIGEHLLKNKLPLHDFILMVSGRASFEIMQKALMGGIPVVAAVSAPSSLAVDLANNFNMTLLGFVRGGSFNIYSGAERIQSA